MLKRAYQQGVLRAYADAGLVKEAGAAWESAKAVGRGFRDKAKASLGNIRAAVEAQKRAAGLAKTLTNPSLAKAQQVNAMRANREILQHAKPWLYSAGIPAAAGAAGYGAYQGAKKLFPNAFKDEE